MVATPPADTPSSARPSALGEAPVWSLMSGIRTTQPHEDEAVEGEEDGQDGTETGELGSGGAAGHGGAAQ